MVTPPASFPRAKTLFAAVALVCAIGPALRAQTRADSVTERLSGTYWGPRIGFSFLSAPVQDKLKTKNITVAPFILQFGWTNELRFVISDSAPMLASQLVFLVGGAEQGVLLPSINWLLGIRGTGGTEFGLGPSVSLAGANIVVAAGVTQRSGGVNIPWNVSVVLGKPGVRVSFLTGFNIRRSKG